MKNTVKNYNIYWYKLPEHTDIMTQGYVGITNNITRRKQEHKRNSTKANTHFYKAICKYGYDNLEFNTINTGLTLKEASELEAYYRPNSQIGWNESIGGITNIGTHRQTPITMYHKDSYVITHFFDSIEQAANTLQISAARIRQAKARNSSNYGLDGWAILIDPMHDRTSTKTIEQLRTQTLKGIKKSKPSVFKGVTDRWSEADKQRISKQHKNKIITEKQKDTVRAKNRANHTSCKQVVLQHINNLEMLHTFHSISEASRQLDIPLPRLKSKASRPLGRHGKDGWAIVSLGSE